jgi:hypothetical protein
MSHYVKDFKKMISRNISFPKTSTSLSLIFEKSNDVNSTGEPIWPQNRIRILLRANPPFHIHFKSNNLFWRETDAWKYTHPLLKKKTYLTCKRSPVQDFTFFLASFFDCTK